MLLRCVFESEPFHHADTAFAKGGCSIDRHARQVGHGLRGFHRSCEIARVDGGQRLRFQRARRCLSLSTTTRGQRSRSVTTKTTFGVSSGLTMTNEEDVCSELCNNGHFTHYLSSHCLGFQLLGLIMSDECVDERIKVAFHHEIELVNSQADAVIANTILFEVVGANLL